MNADGLYEFKFSEKIHLNKCRNKLEDMLHNGEMFLRKLEELIEQVPGQWLMYYPVWPDQVNLEL